jgi:hypothetical protein
LKVHPLTAITDSGFEIQFNPFSVLATVGATGKVHLVESQGELAGKLAAVALRS